MSFRIEALPREPFRDCFELSAGALEERGARLEVVPEHPGYPCRVGLRELEKGERALLINWEHQPARSPYRSSHAIFVGEESIQARPDPGEIPRVLTERLLSIRGFDLGHQIVDADVVEGGHLAGHLDRMFGDRDVDYVHLHFAKRGCFAAKAVRPDG